MTQDIAPNHNTVPFVVGIAAASGGGKTALVLRAAELLPGSSALFFDDYGNPFAEILDFEAWFDRGADFDEVPTPLLMRDLRALRSEESITTPLGALVEPTPFIVFEAPLGRAHRGTGDLIDLLVYIDTPLEVALARRFRDMVRQVAEEAGPKQQEELIENVRSLESYIDQYLGNRGALAIYQKQVEQVKPGADLVLDGNLTTDVLAKAVVSEVRKVRGA